MEDREPGVERLVGESAAMQALRMEVGLLGPLASTVLLCGETGVGKGVVARALHRASGRSRFVHVDCAALSATVIESELFGHERGAFTGAVTRRVGCFERAAGGTLFLDEIGELEPTLQAKLLRVLQDREFERIGGERTLAMTARVVAATSRDLEGDLRRGRFRADLYYRLAVLRVDIPPLRERPEDVAPLARDALARIARGLGRPPPRLGDALCTRLAAQPWPGNVRELCNVLERVLVRCRSDEVRPWELDAAMAGPAPGTAAPGPADGSPDAACIRRALRAAGGNVARAARELGLPRSTLRHRMRREGLSASPAPRAHPTPPGVGRSR